MIEGGRPLSLHPGHSVRQKVAPSTSTVRTSKPGPARPQLSHRKPSGQRSVSFGSLIPAPSPLDGGTSDLSVVRSPVSPTREYARTVSTGIERSRLILTASRRYYQARSVLKIDSVADPRLLPTGEAARAVGVSPRTLQRWVREGLVKPTQLTAGGHHRWDVEDLRAQIRALNESSESD